MTTSGKGTATMQEAWRTYLELATGLTEVSRKQVRKVVKEVVGKGNATADQVKGMTGDLLAANSANREALGKLVKFEVDKALGRVGLATVDEVSELTARVHDLERQLREAKANGGKEGRGTGAATGPAKSAARKVSPAKAATAKATTAKATR